MADYLLVIAFTLLLILVACVIVVDFYTMVRAIQKTLFARVKNPFLMLVISLVIASLLAWGLIQVAMFFLIVLDGV